MSPKTTDSSPESTLTPYEWGKVINFGIRGNAIDYCKTGWSDPENGLVWTKSTNCRMSFSITPPTADVTLVLTCSPFTSKGLLESQELQLYVNFMRIEYLVLNKHGTIEIVIPKHVLAVPFCHIDFYIRTVRSPAELGLGPDVRSLGLALNRLVLVHG